jgi:hypothetical protein
MTLSYMWFYMQKEKSIVDVIDVYLVSFPTHRLKETKLWISNILCFFFKLRKQKQDTWFSNVNTKYINLWFVQ